MGRATLFGEVTGNSPFQDFGDSYAFKANAGVRIAFLQTEFQGVASALQRNPTVDFGATAVPELKWLGSDA